MTDKAQQLSQTIKEVSWDWETMQPSHHHTIAVATLRAVVSLLQYDNSDWQEPNNHMIIDVKDVLELVNELENLK